MYLISKAPENAPDEAEICNNLTLKKGIPVAVNGEKLAPVALLEKLNEIGAKMV